MFCIKCGKENREGAKICYNCGALLAGQKPEETPAKTPEPVERPPEPEPPAPSQSHTPYEANSWNNQPYGTPPPVYGAPPPFGAPSGYGAPFQPRFPVAPNGIPYAVIDHPNAFYSYTNKDGNQTYAAYSSMTMRFIGAIIDTLIMSVPAFFITLFIYMLTVPDNLAQDGNIPLDNPDLVRANNLVFLATGTIYLLYSSILTGMFGQTLGHRVMGIKVMRLDGSKPDFRTALIRNLFGYSWILSRVLLVIDSPLISFLGFILGIIVLIGFSAAGWHPRKQGWHDRLAETVVVLRTELVKGVNY